MQSWFIGGVRPQSPLSNHSLKSVPLGTSPGAEHEYGSMKRGPVAPSQPSYASHLSLSAGWCPRSAALASSAALPLQSSRVNKGLASRAARSLTARPW